MAGEYFHLKISFLDLISFLRAKVGREAFLDQHDDPVVIKRRVMRYQGLDIPEAFLVVRT